MISTKTVKIRRTSNYSTQTIEAELKNMGFDVLRWAITAYDDEFYTLNLAVVEE